MRKIKEDADARRGRRSIFKTNEFSGLLKSSKYEENGKIDWPKIGTITTFTVPCKKTRDFCDFPYKTAILE